MTPRRFWLALGIVAVVALAVRVAWIEVKGPEVVGIDGLTYHGSSRLLADGEPYLEPAYFGITDGRVRAPGAAHPPAYGTVLVVPRLLGFDSLRSSELFSAVLGVGGVVLVGLAGRRIAGPVPGVVAAAAVALGPVFWINDGMLMAESLALPLLGASLLFAHRAIDEPGWADTLVLGLLLGLLVLTRAEATVLVALLALAVAWSRRRGGWLRAVGRAVAALLVAGVVVTPWAVFNLTRFERPTLLTTSIGAGLLGANCPATYSGEGIGAWAYFCTGAVDPDRDSSVRDEEARRRAVRYARAHIDRWPTVGVARLGRTFGFWDPLGTLQWEDGVEHRSRRVQLAGLVQYYVTLPLAIVGAVVLWGRRPLAPLAALILGAAMTSLMFYGQNRFRLSADLALTVLASVAVVDLWRRFHERGSERPSQIVLPQPADPLVSGRAPGSAG